METGLSLGHVVFKSKKGKEAEQTCSYVYNEYRIDLHSYFQSCFEVGFLHNWC